jgi:hypothetical protein
MRSLQKHQSFYEKKQEEAQRKAGTEKVLQKMQEEYGA